MQCFVFFFVKLEFARTRFNTMYILAPMGKNNPVNNHFSNFPKGLTSGVIHTYVYIYRCLPWAPHHMVLYGYYVIGLTSVWVTAVPTALLCNAKIGRGWGGGGGGVEYRKSSMTVQILAKSIDS